MDHECAGLGGQNQSEYDIVNPSFQGLQGRCHHSLSLHLHPYYPSPMYAKNVLIETILGCAFKLQSRNLHGSPRSFPTVCLKEVAQTTASMLL